MTRIFFAFGLLFLALLTLLRSLDPYPVALLRATYFDMLQRAAPREPADLPVRVVDIDEASLQDIGQWPWPRDILADLVDRLAEYGAAVIAFDVLFPEADRLSPIRVRQDFERRGLLLPDIADRELGELDNDLRFADAVSSAPVVLGTALVGEEKVASVPIRAGFAEIGLAPSADLPRAAAVTPILPVLADAASGIGLISVSPGGESPVVRTVPLVWSTEAGLVPSLSIETLRVALGESTFVLHGLPDFKGVAEELRVGGYSVPTTPDGQIWVRFRSNDPSLYVSARDVLADGWSDAVRQAVEGQIVFIGTSAAGLLDIRTTALGESVPGVSIHAQIVEQILLEDFLKRDAFVEAIEVVAFLALGLLVLFVIVFAGPVPSVLSGFVAGLAVLIASWILFLRHGILFDATYSLAGGFMSFSALAAFRFVVADRDKRMIRQSFSRYIAPEVLSEIETRGHKIELGGVTRPITVMFCDIRNFTPLSETMPASDLVRLLNKLFSKIGREILAEKGTIDKFIGDAVMCFWNAPLEMPDHAGRAAMAALGIRRAVREFNRDGSRPPIALAIGAATGMALVGNIGSDDRFNYSAVGDAVNKASRIETSCRHLAYDIVLSGELAESVEGMATLFAGSLSLKGVSGSAETFILVGGRDLAASPGFKELSRRHDALIAGLRSNDAAVAGILAECRDLSRSVEPGLADFYDRIPDRRLDFSDPGLSFASAERTGEDQFT